MRPTFDLLESPWIPCIGADGRLVELGLRDALVQAHELREIHGESPLVTAALHRLLLAVLHRVFGPASYKEWGRLWETGRWDPARLDDYLDRWRDRFDLFHPERPFYQAPDDRVRPKPLNRLVHEIAHGNNTTLFDHHIEEKNFALTPAQAARALVALQCFGLAGLSGLPQKYTDGPCARGVLFLVQGENLFQTLALNLVRYPDGTDQPDDRPVWEASDPFLPERTRPLGRLDLFTWQNRRILLYPEEMDGSTVVRQMTEAPALRLDADVLDPMKHYSRDERRGPRLLRFHEGRALWRDSVALLQLRTPGYHPPRAFSWLAELVDEGCLDLYQTRRYLALGMDSDQAKVRYYRMERMPLPLRYLTQQELVDSLKEALQMAEDVSRQLWGATRTLATLILSPQADTGEGHQPEQQDLDGLMSRWAVDRFYWSRLELPFREMMESLPEEKGEEALETWRKTLRQTAWQAFNRLTNDLGYDPHALKAVVRARGQLAAGLKKALPSQRD